MHTAAFETEAMVLVGMILVIGGGIGKQLELPLVTKPIHITHANFIQTYCKLS